MYRAYRHMGMYRCMGCTDVKGSIQMYGGVQMYEGVYRCIGHTDIWEMYGAYKHTGGHTAV